MLPIMSTSLKATFPLRIEFGREVDGRWIADVPLFPGVTVYGRSKHEAKQRVIALAMEVITDLEEHGELDASVSRLFDYGVARR